MTQPLPTPVTVIEARAAHKTSNALKVTFSTGPGAPFAVAHQGAGDTKRAKFGTLLGFKNGGSGRHVINFTDGRTLGVQSRPWRWSTILTSPDGTEVGTIKRGDTSTARAGDGSALMVFKPDGDDAKAADAFKMVVESPEGEPVGHLYIIRTAGGWTMPRLLDAAWQEYIWWDHAGQSLPIPIVGALVMLSRPVSDLEQDVLLAVCVDIVIGLNVYFTEMGTVPKSGWPLDPENR